MKQHAVVSYLIKLWNGVVISGLILLPALTSAQTTKYACAPAPDVAKALQQVEALEDEEPMIGFDPAREKKLKLLAELLRKYPDNLFVHENYQNIKGRIGATFDESVSAEYRTRMEKSPNDPVAQYLYARTLVGRQTKEAVSLLERASQLPQAHLQLLTVYGGNNSFSDPAKLQTHLQSFRTACPESLAYHSRLFPATNKELLNTATTMFRAQIKERRDAEALATYPRLWLMERNNLAPAEARQQQEDDLKRLRAMNLTTEKNWFDALLFGYRQTNDAEGLRWAYEQMERNFPKSLLTVRQSDQRMHAEYRLPAGAATPEAIRAYQGMWQASGKLLEKWPLDLPIWNDRVIAMFALPELSAAEVQVTVDDWRKAMDKSKGSPAFLNLQQGLCAPIADEYLRRNIRLAQIQPMIEAGFKASDDNFQRLMQNDVMPAQLRANQMVNARFAYWNGWAVLARYYSQQGQPQKAREALENMNADMAQHKPADNAPPFIKNNYEGFRAIYLEGRGHLAEAENRKLDAVINYQNAIAAMPKVMVGQFISKARADMLHERAEKLWKELGGTGEGKMGWAFRKSSDK